MQKSSMYVGDIMWMFFGMKPNLVGGTMSDPPFNPATGHPYAEAIRVMVTPVATLRTGGATELCCENHQRFIEHSA